jgi:preprotein translocase subunit SecD
MKWNTMVCAAALLVGWAAVGCKEDGAALRVFLQASDRLPEGRRQVIVVRNPPMNVIVNPLSELSELDLVEATAVKTPTRKQLVFQFDPHGARVIETFTGEHRGELYVLTINAVAVAAPLIREVIRDGKLVVDVDGTDEELDKLVKGLNTSARRSRLLQPNK